VTEIRAPLRPNIAPLGDVGSGHRPVRRDGEQCSSNRSPDNLPLIPDLPILDARPLIARCAGHPAEATGEAAAASSRARPRRRSVRNTAATAIATPVTASPVANSGDTQAAAPAVRLGESSAPGPAAGASCGRTGRLAARRGSPRRPARAGWTYRRPAMRSGALGCAGLPAARRRHVDEPLTPPVHAWTTRRSPPASRCAACCATSFSAVDSMIAGGRPLAAHRGHSVRQIDSPSTATTTTASPRPVPPQLSQR
jgi:hypothetical protein